MQNVISMLESGVLLCFLISYHGNAWLLSQTAMTLLLRSRWLLRHHFVLMVKVVNTQFSPHIYFKTRLKQLHI